MQNTLIAAAAPSDVARLTRLMQRGDEEAYREFFRLYFQRLLAYLLVVTRGNEAQARDLAQQTMIKVARHIRVFDDEEALWRWLAVLARTAAVDEGRRSRRYFAFLDRWRRQPVPMEEPHAATELMLDELLAGGIETLATEERRLLERKYSDGASVRDIAAEFGVTEKAIESRLGRVRAKLKENVLKGLHE